jgi:hypothetical protein
MNQQVADVTLDLIKGALANPAADITKSITTGTGLVAYDLQGPAKNLYPTLTPLRNSIPRVGGGIGVATNWKTINKLIGSGFDAMGWVPEGQRSARMSYTSAPKAANYVTLGEEDQVSFEAVNAGKGFEDVRSSMALRLLQKTMIKEEKGILAGNGSLQLGTCPTPTLSAAGAGATLPGATYSVIAIALTMEGYLQSSVANGVATSKLITGADGASYTLNGGASQKSGNATQAVTLGQTLAATVASVNGAVAYAWFVGAAGSERLEQITTINSAVFSTPLLGTGQTASSIAAADNSANPGLAFDGLMSTALLPQNSAYIRYLPTGTAGQGTALTPSGFGTVVEIDDMLKGMWDTSRLSADVIYVSSQELRNITKKCLSTSGNASLLSYQNGAGLSGKPFELAAGGVIQSYFNPYTPEGGKMIPVKLHPDLAPGTILAYCEKLPAHYQSNNVSNVAEIKTRQDYYQIDWPVTKRQYETGVYSEQVLAVYAPFAMAMILNIANG